MKKVLFGIIFVIFALVACGGNIAADNYRFEKPQFVHNNVQVEMVTVANETALKELAKSKGAENYDKVAAFSTISPDHNRCTIYSVDPQVNYEPEFLGHELTHCVYGQFHPNQN